MWEICTLRNVFYQITSLGGVLPTHPSKAWNWTLGLCCWRLVLCTAALFLGESRKFSIDEIHPVIYSCLKSMLHPAKISFRLRKAWQYCQYLQWQSGTEIPLESAAESGSFGNSWLHSPPSTPGAVCRVWSATWGVRSGDAGGPLSSSLVTLTQPLRVTLIFPLQWETGC